MRSLVCKAAAAVTFAVFGFATPTAAQTSVPVRKSLPGYPFIVDVKMHVNESAKPYLFGETNLPDGMTLSIDVFADVAMCYGHCLPLEFFTTIKSGRFIIGPIFKRDWGRMDGLPGLAPGRYEAQISSQYPQESSVQRIIGDGGRMMRGPLVRQLMPNVWTVEFKAPFYIR